MEKWFLKNKKGDREGLVSKYGISPVFAQILINRDIRDVEKAGQFLKDDPSGLYDPALLPDCEKAAGILRTKIAEQKRIRIIGDYDCDGICATFILKKCLGELGAVVDERLPHRILDGYGLNIRLIEEALQDGVDTILTCDNGIAAAEEIAFAKAHGMTVIVTDHHEVPFVQEEGVKRELLPPADAVVDMKRVDSLYPFQGICGAVTAWKLCQLLLGSDHPLIAQMTVYAALATVCDVMDLVDENRVILKQGLKRINSRPPVGLKALAAAYEIYNKKISAYHLGFLIGPCLNATGRLESAQMALDLLDMEDEQQAYVYAHKLKELNEQRKEMTRNGSEEAIRKIQADASDGSLDKVLVQYLPDCHESVAGIIAGRVREACHRPTIIFTKAQEGVKGSGRSMECYDMFTELSACKNLFTKFGGHKMAAGISMDSEEKIAELRRRLNEQCTLTEDDFRERVLIDLALPLSSTSLALAKELEKMEPCGVANPRPLFAERNLILTSASIMGQKQNAVRLTVKSRDGLLHQVVFFGDLKPFHDFLDEKFGDGASKRIYTHTCAYPFHMVYQLQVNRYQMRESLQIVMKYYC
ncbi:MAG: single-stranded-DNA-specific exonuclease RecJ [Lachnospiraceae bacterium]|nr:single-stranded-DNA-specific exonuclease RecJ [Lachnospiraceae bacterium]